MSPKKNLNTFLKIIIAPVVVFFSIDGYGRIPANLAGTDIFPETITYRMPKLKQSSKASRGKNSLRVGAAPGLKGQEATAENEEVEVVLPTKVLNLSYGAEFFTVVAQPLWNFGELVRMAEKPAVAPQAAEEGVAAGGVAETLAIGQQPVAVEKIKELHNFYKDIVTKEPLPLTECNPLAILMRALFTQIPGTSSLEDFRVSVLCCVNDKDATPQENSQQTLTQWANVVAATLSIYESMAQEKDLQKLIDLINATFKKIHLTKDNQLVDRLTRNIFNFVDNEKQPKLSLLLLRCITWSETNGFGRDFPLRILIGGVYALAGDNQENIFHFYRALKVALEKAMPAITTQIARLSIPTAGEDIPAPFTKIDCLPGAAITPQTPIPQHAFSLLLLQLGSFQPLAYTNTKPRPEIKSFPDCFETTLRNIVLFLLINDNGGFKADLVAEDYKAFFRQHGSMQAQTSQTARDQWAALVSNIPGALYARNQTLNGAELGALEYKHELEPSLIQLLFFLNKIFELEVDFEGHALSIQAAQADINKAFIATNLSRVVAALKTKLVMAEDPLTEVVQSKTSGSDITDVQGNYITLKILNGVGTMTVSIDVCGHAQIIPDKKSADLELTPLSLALFFYLSTALKNYAFNPAEMNPVYALPLLNKPLSITQLAPILTSSQAMLRILYAAITRDYEIDKRVWLSNLALLVSIGQGFEQAIAAATEGIKSSDYNVAFDGALVLFEALFEQNQGFEQAIVAAVEGIKSNDFIVKVAALDLFTALFKKDQGFEQAIVAAVGGMQSTDASVRSSALDLFKALVKKDQGFEQAIAPAVEGMQSSDASVRSSALDLFKALVKKDQGFEQAIAPAVEGIKSSDASVRSSALDLFKALLQKGQGFKQAIAVAVEGMQSSDASRSSALDLFKALVKKDQGFKQAIAVAVEGMQSSDYFVQFGALDLFKALFEKRQGFEQAQSILNAGGIDPTTAADLRKVLKAANKKT
jgi:tetratricopeptide (TPR) repeat protein